MKRDILKLVLEKFKLNNPLSEQTRKYIRKQRKQSLIAILKRQKKYSWFVFFSISVMFWLKRIGLSVSLVKCGVIAAFTTIIAAGVISATTVSTIRHYLYKKPEVKQQVEKPDSSKSPDEIHILLKEKQKIIINKLFSIGMVPFQSEPAIAVDTQRISDSLYNGISRILGPRSVFYGAGGNKKIRTDQRIIGSVVQLGKGDFITAKIININNARIRFHVTESAASPKDINRACSVLSRKLAARLK